MSEDNDLGPVQAVMRVAIPQDRYMISHTLRNSKSVLCVYDNEDGSITAYFKISEDPDDLTLQVITFSNIC